MLLFLLHFGHTLATLHIFKGWFDDAIHHFCFDLLRRQKILAKVFRYPFWLKYNFGSRLFSFVLLISRVWAVFCLFYVKLFSTALCSQLRVQSFLLLSGGSQSESSILNAQSCKVPELHFIESYFLQLCIVCVKSDGIYFRQSSFLQFWLVSPGFDFCKCIFLQLQSLWVAGMQILTYVNYLPFFGSLLTDQLQSHLMVHDWLYTRKELNGSQINRAAGAHNYIPLKAHKTRIVEKWFLMRNHRLVFTIFPLESSWNSFIFLS